MQASLTITFQPDDFYDALWSAGIDPATVTVDEWSTFTDRFLDGTAWSEVAGYAAEVISEERGV